LFSPSSVFPAKAGTQTLSLRRIVRGTSSSFDVLRMRMNGWGVDVTPSPNPLPLKGARAYPLLALSLRERVG
jgi:hypothetical protein